MQKQPISLWVTTAEEDEVLSAPLSGDRIDVAIVGGGYTGLSTALHCAERGLSAQVIEAECIGYGGSGRNVGFVNAAAWLPPDKVHKTLGPEYGPRFIKQFSAAPARVFELIEKHRIQCEATRTGTVHAANSRTGFRELRDRHAQWCRLGEPVELIDHDHVHQLTGSREFHGGLFDHRAGTINPMAYCRGLARAANEAGARISIGVRATKLKRIRNSWRIETNQGNLRAGSVVLGTNAYTDHLWPGLNSAFSAIHYLQIATKPLGATAAHILPGRQGLWDTGRIMFNIRRDAKGRILIGTMGRVVGSTKHGLTHRWALRRIQRIFPDLGPIEFEQAWHGRIAMTQDHLPRIHRLAEGLWTTIGYNGRGITTGTLFGQSLADLLTGMDPKKLPLPLTNLSSVPCSRLKSCSYDLVFTANQIINAIR